MDELYYTTIHCVGAEAPPRGSREPIMWEFQISDNREDNLFLCKPMAYFTVGEDYDLIIRRRET